MIQPLRSHHRRMITALAIALPVAFAAGLLNRPPETTTVAVPASLSHVTAPDGTILWQRTDLWPEFPISVAFYEYETSRALEVRATQDLKKPNVLLYWAANRGEGPGQATLLGAISTRPRRFHLPVDADDGRGHLLLYSLGHQESLGWAEVRGQ